MYSSYVSHLYWWGKKNRTWRLYVDYRDLNKLTIKERFLIPLVDDLLDELHGSTVLSKIDLRASYNQVRMDEVDIQKTTFMAHVEHFEYLVILFGLTNVPKTIQGLMNEVLCKFIRKFLLVFIDDIFIYSSIVK